MAIIKELNSSFGVLANYHRITSISINYKIKKAIICVASYATKEARINNFSPLEEIDIEVPKEDYLIFKDTNVLENAYLWLKENVVGFENSIDDFESFNDFEDIEEKDPYKDEGY